MRIHAIHASFMTTLKSMMSLIRKVISQWSHVLVWLSTSGIDDSLNGVFWYHSWITPDGQEFSRCCTRGTQGMKHTSQGSTLPLKPRADIIRSQGGGGGERSQISTVQAVAYIEVRSPTEDHRQMPNKAPRVTSQ